MRIQDDIAKCVTFIGRKENDKIVYRGTGFFVVREHNEEGTAFSFGYLVTAKHVADAIRESVFYLRINKRATKTAVDIAMNWEPGRETVWYTHPTDRDADVAITTVRIPREFDALCLPSEMILTEEKKQKLNIGIGDEVFMMGLFGHLKGKARNIPIARVGNIAMFPDEQIAVQDHLGHRKEIDAFLVEARSIGGLSGSPVMTRQSVDLVGLHLWGSNEPATLTAYNAQFYLIGVVSSHWDADPADINNPEPRMVRSGVNVGLAVVVPASKIVEILEGEELTEMRNRRAKEAVAKQKSSAVANLDLNAEPTITKREFMDVLKKASRRVPSSKSGKEKK